jgi:hypothetical protein
MRKGHKIRAMLDPDPDNARVELFFAWQYLMDDHEPPDDDNQDDGSSGDDDGL